MRWPRLNLPPDRRIRLISIGGAALLVVVIATSAAVLTSSDQATPFGTTGEKPYGLQTAAQQAIPAPSAQGLASPHSASARPAVASATYRTLTLLGLGGFDTEVTVSNPGRTSWQVVLTLPEAKPVENRSANLVNLQQQGGSVTLTPVSAAEETVTFTVRLHALLALGKSVTACTIDTVACTAS